MLTNMADNGPASGPRKPRKVNFTQAEMDVMIKYSNKYSKFLFCKPHSGPMQRRKLKAWEELQRSVNAVSIEERTQDEIKTKLKKYRYELFKKAKEQLSKECKCSFLFIAVCASRLINDLERLYSTREAALR